MKRQIALLVTLEESEIDSLEKLSKQELQQIQEKAALSVQNGLIELGLDESRTHVALEESEQDQEGEITFFIMGGS